MIKQINEQENILGILGMFPFFFFFLGLTFQLIISNIENWWLSWLVMFIGLEVYFLFVIWFCYELVQFKFKIN